MRCGAGTRPSSYRLYWLRRATLDLSIVDRLPSQGRTPDACPTSAISPAATVVAYTTWEVTTGVLSRRKSAPQQHAYAVLTWLSAVAQRQDSTDHSRAASRQTGGPPRISSFNTQSTDDDTAPGQQIFAAHQVARERDCAGVERRRGYSRCPEDRSDARDVKRADVNYLTSLAAILKAHALQRRPCDLAVCRLVEQQV